MTHVALLPSRSLSSPGVIDVVTSSDFPSASFNATAANDSDTSPFYLLPVGQTCANVGAYVAVVVADSLPHARRGAQLARLFFTAGSLGPDQPKLSLVRVQASADRARAALLRLASRGFAKRNGLNVDDILRETAQANQHFAKSDVKPSAYKDNMASALRGNLAKLDMSHATNINSKGDSLLRSDPPGGEKDHLNPDNTAHNSIVIGRPVSAWWPAARSEGKIAVEGTFSIGGQRHFYLETNTANAVPVEGGGMQITCGHQNPTLTQVTRLLSSWRLPVIKEDC